MSCIYNIIEKKKKKIFSFLLLIFTSLLTYVCSVTMVTKFVVQFFVRFVSYNVSIVRSLINLLLL